MQGSENILHVVLNEADYRSECFNHPDKEYNNLRYQIDFYFANEDFEEGIDDESDRYTIRTGHFTHWYKEEESNPQTALTFLKESLIKLILLSDNTVNGEPDFNRIYQDFRHVDLDYTSLCRNSDEYFKFLKAFDIKTGRTIYDNKTLDLMRSNFYLYYSCLKWLVYSVGVGVIGLSYIFEGRDDMIDFCQDEKQ